MQPVTDEILAKLTDVYTDLSPQLRKAASYVLDNPNDVGVNSMRQVAAEADITPNTLVRMARAIGFDSYEDFRSPFKELLKSGVESYPDRARWLQSIAKGGRHGGLLSNVAATAFDNLEHLFSSTGTEEIKAVADMIVSAPRTYVLGTGAAFSLAHSFWYVASMAFDTMSLTPREGGLPIDDIAKIKQDEILIAITFEPYRSETVTATKLAKRHGAKIVAITDSRTSPIALEADTVFVVPTTSPQFFSSMIAASCLLETLVSFMVADADPKAIAAIEEFHQLRHESGVYTKE